MAVQRLSTVADFAQINSSRSLAVVHFDADWAPQCKQVSDVLAELANLPNIKSNETQFFVCHAEEVPDISSKYKIDAVPTVILLKHNKVIERVDGVDIPKLTSKVQQHSGISNCKSTDDQPLEERMKNLINRYNIMVFMKGNKTNPRCGFSRTLIQILEDIQADYDTFDILLDEEVRQGLKEYSDWPTYPQVYVKGELIGGLDIIKEMQKSGELEATLKSS